MNSTTKIFLSITLAIFLGGCSEKKDPSSINTAEAAKTTQSIEVLNWGPKETVAGKSFAVQKNGNSAIWFEQRGINNAAMVEIWFDDHRLESIAISPDKVGTAEVPPELITKPGKYAIYIRTNPEGKRIDIGIFEITAN
jgi:hypothetical protein